MNLENFNVVELNAQEKQEIVGGSFWGWVVRNVESIGRDLSLNNVLAGLAFIGAAIVTIAGGSSYR